MDAKLTMTYRPEHHDYVLQYTGHPMGAVYTVTGRTEQEAYEHMIHCIGGYLPRPYKVALTAEDIADLPVLDPNTSYRVEVVWDKKD
jgi:hypothetical protein